MFEIIPVDANDQVIEATLDDTVYFIGLSWNSTGELWTMSLRNGEGTLVISGLAVVINHPLTFGKRYLGMPKGELIVTGTQPDRLSFIEGRAVLHYVPLADLVGAGLGKYYGGA